MTEASSSSAGGPTHRRYKRSRFSTALPLGRRYTAAHVWLWEAEPSLWHVGFTKFATRMLGDPVEFDFEVKVDEDVQKGQVLGWIEGFKAVTDIYSPFSGTFAGSNPVLDQEIDLLASRLYDKGWLFSLRGEPDEACFDVEGYVQVLDATIDKMLGEQADI